jgi:hypothetical protein
MRSLGYQWHGAHGGDWGSVTSRELGRTHPGQVTVVHMTVLPGSAATSETDERELAALSGPVLDQLIPPRRAASRHQ